MTLLEENIQSYLEDESKLTGRASLVALPESEAEAAGFIRSCRRSGTPVTPSGARTGIAGGAVPRGGCVLSTERMDAVREIRFDGNTGAWLVRLDPGVSLSTLMGLAESRTIAGPEPSGLEEFRHDPGRYFFPVDATETTASVGGMAATNASGARSYGYGPMRRYVRALRVVLADGDVLHVRRGAERADSDHVLHAVTESGAKLQIPAPAYRVPPVKHTAGLYAGAGLDLIDLFIGSEGTLGLIVEVELALAPKPERWFGGLAFLPDEESALRLISVVRNERPSEVAACHPIALEYFDEEALRLAGRAGDREQLGLPAFPADAGAAVFFEQGCADDELEALYEAWAAALAAAGGSIDDVWSALDEKEERKLKGLRHHVPEEINRIVGENRRKCPGIHKVGTDLAVPDDKLPAMLEAYRRRLGEEGIPAIIFGHAGANNLHVNMLPTESGMLRRAKELHLEWARLAVGFGGTVVAEHGLGKLKGELLHILYGEDEIRQMLAVKQALDPCGLLAPGNSMTSQV